MEKKTQREENKECTHDWAYDSEEYATKRICRLCRRVERRKVWVSEWYGFGSTEWTLMIEDINYSLPIKEKKK